MWTRCLAWATKRCWRSPLHHSSFVPLFLGCVCLPLCMSSLCHLLLRQCFSPSIFFLPKLPVWVTLSALFTPSSLSLVTWCVFYLYVSVPLPFCTISIFILSFFLFSLYELAVPKAERLFTSFPLRHGPQWQHREKHPEQLPGDARLHGEVSSEECGRGPSEPKDWVGTQRKKENWNKWNK